MMMMMIEDPSGGGVYMRMYLYPVFGCFKFVTTIFYWLTAAITYKIVTCGKGGMILKKSEAVDHALPRVWGMGTMLTLTHSRSADGRSMTHGNENDPLDPRKMLGFAFVRVFVDFSTITRTILPISIGAMYVVFK